MKVSLMYFVNGSVCTVPLSVQAAPPVFCWHSHTTKRTDDCRRVTAAECNEIQGWALRIVSIRKRCNARQACLIRCAALSSTNKASLHFPSLCIHGQVKKTRRRSGPEMPKTKPRAAGRGAMQQSHDPPTICRRTRNAIVLANRALA